MSTELYLGLDCGGSTTRAMVINGDGKTVFEGRSGPANFASTPLELLRRHLMEALTDCPPVTAVCGAFAGLLTAEDESRACGLLAELTPSSRVSARPDYHATLAACPPDTTVCVIAGTGSLTTSLDGTEVVKSGGGGPLLGDDGGAFAIVRSALRRAQIACEVPMDSEFEIGLATEFGKTDLGEIQSAIYRSPHPAQRVARLAPLVVKDFLKGVPYAAKSIAEANDHLYDLIVAHIEQYHREVSACKIVLAGGVWSIDDRYTKYWWEQFGTRLARAQFFEGTILMEPLIDPPVLGACRLASQLS